MQATRPRILYIDDEKINLLNFQQAFGRDFEIHTAADAEEGLELLASLGEMDVVISDQRMPGLSGIDLLFKVRELHPDSVRMVITAYTEVRDLIDAINRGHIYKYIVKPWEEESLRITIRNAAELYRLTRRNRELVAELREANSRLEERVLQRTSQLERLNGDLNAKVAELEEAMNRVNELQRLLPICSYCKKIRDDRNYWQEIETYMAKYDIAFTHSVCPGCYETYVKADLESYRLLRRLRDETP